MGESVSAEWSVLDLSVTDAQCVLEPSGTERINFNALPAVRNELIDLSGKTSKQLPFIKDPNAPFAHPFYWSPFVLIGNWR